MKICVQCKVEDSVDLINRWGSWAADGKLCKNVNQNLLMHAQ